MLTMQTSKDPNLKAVRTESLLNALRERRLLTLVIEAASSCNLKCNFCDAHSGRAPAFKENAGLMRPETWAKVLGDIKAYAADRGRLDMIQFHGNGEPLLNKRLPQMVAELKSAAATHSVRVISNGVLLSPAKVNDLADAGVDEIHVSVDTIDPEQYRAVKKTDDCLKVLGNVAHAVEIAEQRRDFQLYIKYFTENTSNAYGMRESDSAALVRAFSEVAQHSSFVHLKQMPLVDVGHGMLNNREDYAAPCEVPFYLLYIMHSGKVSACCSDVFGAMTVGHLMGTEKAPPVTLLDVAGGPRLHLIREKHLQGRCNEIRLCAGCGNRTSVDLSEMPTSTKDDIASWISPSIPVSAGV